MNPACRVSEALQGTPEWFYERLGRVTGSRASAMLSTIKSGGEAAGRRNLRTALVCERLTSQPADPYDYCSRDMLAGLELEPEAREVYQATTGRTVETVGFIARTDYMAGCSADGLVGDDGLIEIKCGKPATHLRYLRLGTLPSEYAPQVTHNLWTTGLAWCDFVSYCPRFPLALQVFIVRVTAADINLTAYQGLLRLFLKEVDEEEQELLSRL